MDDSPSELRNHLSGFLWLTNYWLTEPIRDRHRPSLVMIDLVLVVLNVAGLLWLLRRYDDDG